MTANQKDREINDSVLFFVGLIWELIPILSIFRFAIYIKQR